MSEIRKANELLEVIDNKLNDIVAHAFVALQIKRSQFWTTKFGTLFTEVSSHVILLLTNKISLDSSNILFFLKHCFQANSSLQDLFSDQ